MQTYKRSVHCTRKTKQVHKGEIHTASTHGLVFHFRREGGRGKGKGKWGSGKGKGEGRGGDAINAIAFYLFHSTLVYT